METYLVAVHSCHLDHAGGMGIVDFEPDEEATLRMNNQVAVVLCELARLALGNRDQVVAVLPIRRADSDPNA
jgi:hypothetical protein